MSIIHWGIQAVYLLTTTLYDVITVIFITKKYIIISEIPMIKICKEICRLDRIGTLREVINLFEISSKNRKICAEELKKRLNEYEYENTIYKKLDEDRKKKEEEEEEKEKEKTMKFTKRQKRINKYDFEKTMKDICKKPDEEDSQKDSMDKEENFLVDWTNEFKKKYDENDFTGMGVMIEKIKKDEKEPEEQKSAPLNKILEDLETLVVGKNDEN